MKELAELKQGEIIAPDFFIEKAISAGSDIAVLNGLFELKQKHEAHEAKKAFYAAMHRFQQQKPVLKRSQEVSFGNGKAAYKFCPLSEIEKSIKQPLADCGLSYRFENTEREGRFGVRCIVTHVSGHSEVTEMFAPADDSGNKNKIQGIGSTNTYLMRYTLIASLSLTTADEDNDGATSGDLPYTRLLEHNEVLRSKLYEVQAVKDFLATGEYAEAVEIVYGWTEREQQALWIAPTYGGIFTTEERKIMKESPEWVAARNEYFKSK